MLVNGDWYVNRGSMKGGLNKELTAYQAANLPKMYIYLTN